MRVLVTGAAGFIGGHALRALAEARHELIAFVRPDTDGSSVSASKLVRGDLADVAALAAACRDVDAVVHAAAVVRGHGPWEDFQVGVQATSNVLTAMRDAGLRRLVHVSSLAVYGFWSHVEAITEAHPLAERTEGWNHYARQKILSERVIWDAHRRGEVEPIVLRAAATLGPGDRASLPAIFGALRGGKMAVLGAGSNYVPFVVVEDLARAIASAVTSPTRGRAFNVSGSQAISQAEFLSACAHAIGVPPPARHVPARMARLAAAVTEWTHRALRRSGQPGLSRVGIAVATSDLVIDTSAARRDLGWVGDASYAQAIEREAAWLHDMSAGKRPEPH